MERKEFIGKLVGEQKTRHDVHGALISEGYSTVGYEAEYAELLKESGQTEPKPIAPPSMPEGISQPATATPHSIDATLPTIGKMLSEGFSSPQRHLVSIVIAGVLLVIANAGLYFLPPVAPLSIGEDAFMFLRVIFSFVSAIVTFFATASLLYVVIKDSVDIGFAEGIQWALQRFFSILWLSILTTFITLGGLVLLIIPALIFGIYTMFSYIVLVREDARGVRALLRSVDLVRGKFWPISIKVSAVVLVFFVIGILLGSFSALFTMMPALEFVGLVLLSFGQIVVTAMCLRAFVTLYDARVVANPLFDLHSYTTLKWIFRAMALIGILVPFLFATALGAYVYSIYNSVNSLEMEDPRLQEEIQWGRENAVEEAELSVGDYVLQTKVESTAVSANVSGGRMGAYDGACADISVLPPVECLDTKESFAVFTRMSTGMFYCVDSTEFRGLVPRPISPLCQ